MNSSNWNMRFRYLIFVCFLFVTPRAWAENTKDYCAIADRAIVHAGKIRELKPKRKIPCLVSEKEQVKSYLLETIATKLPRGKLANEAMVYRAIGMIPESFNYEKGLVDLYLNQIGGYYDPDKRHFIMAAWMPALLQTTVAVHELTHGLQDQYFELSKIMDPKLENSDELTARSAMVEGDANSVMLEQARLAAGQPSILQDDNVESFMLQNIVGLKLMAASSGVPESLQMMLIFPYTSGFRFVHTLLRKGGYNEVNKAFKRLPRSTEEILHPELYFKSDPSFITIESADLAKDLPDPTAHLIYQDTLGEFAISVLLSEHLKNKQAAVEAARGWGGDRVAVFESGARKSVVWRTHWDTPKDADQFYAAMLESLNARFGETAASEWGDYLAKKHSIALKRRDQNVDLIRSY